MSEEEFFRFQGAEPLSVVVLFSGGASGARYLFSESAAGNQNYEIVAGMTDRSNASGIDVFERRNLPAIVVEEGASGEITPKSSKKFFRKIAGAVNKFEPDLILLSGFMRIVRNPLLKEYGGRIINVHPADLRVKEGGKRKYRGTDTVYKTIVSGDREIRSTVHLVTRGVDQGPILVVSEPVQIDRKVVRVFDQFDPSQFRGYADTIQEGMKWICDGPAIEKALDLIGRGKIRMSTDGVMVKGDNNFVSGYYDIESERIIPE